jgi:hypothetical protein
MTQDPAEHDPLTIFQPEPDYTKAELLDNIYIRSIVIPHEPSSTCTALFRMDGICCKAHALLLLDSLQFMADEFLKYLGATFQEMDCAHPPVEDLN